MSALPIPPSSVAALGAAPRAVERVGRDARRAAARPLDLTRYVGALARSAVGAPRGVHALWRREVRDQVYAAAVRALLFVATVAALLGVMLVVQARAQGLRLDLSGALGRLLAALVVRELGPILAAVIVLARSGTAMAAEVAAAGAFGEIEALEALGVDPVRWFALPRVVGGAISVAVLAVVFNASALAGSAAAAAAIGVEPSAFAASLRASLHPSDLWLTVIKGALFGGGVGALCCYAGLLGARTPTDVPRSVSRAVAWSLLFVFGVAALFSLALYT